MRPIFQRKHRCTIHLDFCNETVSTFLVPKIYLDTIFPGEEKKNLRVLLPKLLDKYRGFFAIGNLPFSRKPKTRFQEKGQNLQRLRFRPKNSDWTELGILANGLGVSRCWLFTVMLEMEAKGLGEFLSLPELQRLVTTASRAQPRNLGQITRSKQNFERILHFRV